MADRPEPPLGDALMALFAGAAPLIERAKAAGLFRPAPVNVTPDTPPPPAGAAAPTGNAAQGDVAQTRALHDIIVAQAMKIAALEAEVARLKA